MNKLPSELLLEIAILLPDPKPFRRLCHRFNRICRPKVYWRLKALRCLSITIEEWSSASGDSSYLKYLSIAHEQIKKRKTDCSVEYNQAIVNFDSDLAILRCRYERETQNIKTEWDVYASKTQKILYSLDHERRRLHRERLCARGRSNPKFSWIKHSFMSWDGLRVSGISSLKNLNVSAYDIISRDDRFIIWPLDGSLTLQIMCVINGHPHSYCLPYRCLSLLERFGITEKDDIQALYGFDCFSYYQDEKGLCHQIPNS